MGKLKQRTRLILLASIVFLGLQACNREIQDRIPGEWTYSDVRTTNVTFNGQSSTETTTNTGVANFNDDGSGSFELETNSKDFTWEATEDSVFITSNGSTIKYFAEDNSKDRQEWKSVISEADINYSFTTEITITLTQ